MREKTIQAHTEKRRLRLKNIGGTEYRRDIN